MDRFQRLLTRMKPHSAPLPVEPSSARALEHLFRPRSIAVVGASADPRSFGGFVVANLERFNYRGAIHLVSRSATNIGGRSCVPHIENLPEGVDLAVLAIPEASVLDAVRVLGARRCRAAVLFASGYAEVGPDGLARQIELQQAAAIAGVDLVGPNCMGFTNVIDGVPVTFEPLSPLPRESRPGVGVVAQSGFMAANLRDSLLTRGVPVNAIVSTGNEAGVTIEDVVDWFLSEPLVRVITIYAEQIRQPARFRALARRARLEGKPIVLLLPGRSARARAAAASHTGALAGDHATTLACLRREAVACVDTLDELIDVSTIVARYPLPPVGGTAFMTGSGAMKNVALDLADTLHLELPALTEETTRVLQNKLPAFAVAENPLDYTTIGVRQPHLVGEILHVLLADPGVGNLVLAIPVGPGVAQRDKAEHIVPALALADKPTVLVLTGDGSPLEPFFDEAIRTSAVPLFRSADRALRALACVAEFARARERATRADAIPPAAAVPLPAPAPLNGIYAEHLGKAWLAAVGLPIPRGRLARDADAARAIAREIGYPVVLKAQASVLAHKSDAGGVLVNLTDEAALLAAWDRLHSNIALHRPGLELDGVLVEAMGAPGLELAIGAMRDAHWGPVVMVGLGGIWIEALQDVRLIAADTAAVDIAAELQRLKAAPVLAGTRGQAAIDLDAVAAVVARVGAQMLAQPALTEIDINPLVAYPRGTGTSVLALDALIVARFE